MRDIPILYSTPMVRSIFNDLKGQTRRVCKLAVRAGMPEPEWQSLLKLCPYGQPGDRHWVRETFFAWGRWITRFNPKKGRDEWHFIDLTLEAGKAYLYVADGFSDTQAFQKTRGGTLPMYWKRPAIFMPREACRLVLTVTGVRLERLQDISWSDAMDEGIATSYDEWRDYRTDPAVNFPGCSSPVDSYRTLWESINGAGSWEENPWVWAIDFERNRE